MGPLPEAAFRAAAILTPLNADVRDFNERALRLFLPDAPVREYLSADTATAVGDEEGEAAFFDAITTPEMLNDMEPNDLPPHRLRAKVGT